MKFNKIWTKEKNDLLRKFNKENKPIEFIKEYFGDDLNHHPKNKFKSTKLYGFHKFVNEIKITPESINYTKSIKNSIKYNKKDYIFTFKTKHEYILMLLYVQNFNKSSYEVVFTSKDNYDKYIEKFNEIISLRGDLNEEDNLLLSSIIEQKTNYDEIYSLMKKLSFILLEEFPLLKLMYKIPLSITETNDPIKANLYRNIIEHSFPELKETESISELNKNKKIFYYE